MGTLIDRNTIITGRFYFYSFMYFEYRIDLIYLIQLKKIAS